MQMRCVLLLLPDWMEVGAHLKRMEPSSGVVLGGAGGCSSDLFVVVTVLVLVLRLVLAVRVSTPFAQSAFLPSLSL